MRALLLLLSLGSVATLRHAGVRVSQAPRAPYLRAAGSVASLRHAAVRVSQAMRAPYLRAAAAVAALETPIGTPSGECSQAEPPPLLRYPPAPSLGQCLSFAVPAMGIYIAGPLMSLIDAAFIGRTSSMALAALGPASAISDSGPYLLLFLAVAATNLAAKADLSRDDGAISRMALAALVCAAVGGLAVGGVTFGAATALVTAYCGGGSASSLIPPATTYVQIRALAFPATVVAAVAQAVLIGLKDTRSPMLSLVLAAAVNFSLDLVFVTFLGLGIAGAAWATTASQYCAAALLLSVLWRRDLLRLGGGGVRNGFAAAAAATAKHMRVFLGFAPFFFVQVAKLTMHNSAAASAAVLGGAAAAAHTALYSVANTCFTFGDVGSSLSQAWLPAFGSSPAPARAGGGAAPEPADGVAAPATGSSSFDLQAAWPTIAQLLRTMLLISAGVVTLGTAFVLLGSGTISSDAAVVFQMQRTWPVVAASLVLHGTAVMLEGVLLAQSQLRALVASYGIVALTVLALQALSARMGGGLLGVWGVYVWFQFSRVLLFSWRAGLLRRVTPPSDARAAAPSKER